MSAQRDLKMAHAPVEIIYGVAAAPSWSPDEMRNRFNVLHQHNVTSLDTGAAYGDSETVLGERHAPKEFVIHTKAPALYPRCLTRQRVLDGMQKSLKDLGVDSVDLYYLHHPDAQVPIEETLSAIQDIYAAGKFKRFGLSNFPPEQVQQVYDIQSAAGSVVPTVFQGNYNAVSRHIEVDLFPLLRKLNISFYAYSPIAGGFLVKDTESLKSKNVEGRFSGRTSLGDMYNTLYGKESLYQALDEWGVIADDASISKAALSYRWIAYHSALKKEVGDGLIIGASKVLQLEETLTAVEAGPLDVLTAKRASDIWEKVKHEAPRDNLDFLKI
ncbi:uncharacterized protein KY384_005878 [Bacidia gigantensis]|uniref:uncharacterized protein n=1 Tax=Bacidia gigantensis TaxID=2732470 RepID=UPI001D058750|nr:uncharacterized protein KY384_005878 [Bacidia gigantensis]KAG8529243.1 hypothetical protein KY384_005878 [Bacidia gigantensis]